MNGRSVGFIGGPFDGHRFVVPMDVGRTYRAPMVVLDEGEYDISVQIGEYEIFPMTTRASSEPYWIGIWNGVQGGSNGRGSDTAV